MKTIIVPVDFSQSTGLLYEKAVSLAKAFSSTIYLLHVVLPNEDSSYKDKKEIGLEFAEETQALNSLAQQIREQSIETYALLIEGIAATAILEEAKRLNADLIVLGSHGHGVLGAALAADVSQEIVQHTQCPVFIVPTHPQN